MSKLRVHELARELGRQNREVIEFLKSKGVDVRSHMSMAVSYTHLTLPTTPYV